MSRFSLFPASHDLSFALLRSVSLFSFAWLCAALLHAEPPVLSPPLITGLKNPESVAIGRDGRMFVTVIGEMGKDGDGGVMIVKPGKTQPYATGLDDPKGLV